MNLPQLRALPVPAYRFALFALVVAGFFTALIARPQAAEAGVAGQQEFWNFNFGTDPGELFNPRQLGVDPVDGSVYILSGEVGETDNQLDKFSESGEAQGTAQISRTPEDPSATGRKGLVGIAVDHAGGVVYLVQAETGVNPAHEESPIATKILAFSNQPNGSKQLVPDPPISVPDPSGTGAILNPNELHVDPSNGDLVVSGLDTAGHPILERIDPDGVVPNVRYEELGTTLAETETGVLNFGFDIGDDGTTYILANNRTETTGEIEAFTLPPDFDPGSGTLALTALPGFTAAEAVEGWGSSSLALSLVQPPGFALNGSYGFGPQVTLGSTTDGEETLFWKSGNPTADEPLVVHGYSLQQQATNAVYGGGENARECRIETRSASIAATDDGNVVVLDQGGRVAEASQEPAFGPNVFRFGPGGGECPAPAPLVQLKVGGTEVPSVPAGTSVTLDAGGSEPGAGALAGLTWTIKGPGVNETIHVPGPAPAMQTPFVFSTEGTYTVGLAFETTAPIGIDTVGEAGTRVIAKPKKLTVTAGAATKNLTINKVGSGTVECKDEGASSFSACAPSYGEGHVVKLKATASAGFSFTGWSAFAGSGTVTTACTGAVAECEVKLDADVTGTATFTAVSTKNLTINKVGSGTVECKDEGASSFSACAPSYGEGHVVKLKATASAGFSFTGWSAFAGSGTVTTACTGAVAECEVKLDADVTGTATFTAVPTKTLTIGKDGSGSGTVTSSPGGIDCGASCTAPFPVGKSITLTATPASGSTFAGWNGGGCVGTGTCTVVLSSSDVTVTATFTANPPDNTPPNNGAPPNNGTTPPGNGTTPPNNGGKTEAEKLKERRKKALAKCKKLDGKAKAKCVKHANQIGKPKKKKGNSNKASSSSSSVLASWPIW